MSDAILEVKQLHKSFGEVKAVKGISFQVQAGEVFTIIGPNGAGKTTTLEMIEGLQQPDQGEVRLKGMQWSNDRQAMKEVIGVQPQASALFDLLTVEENLNLFASFYRKSIQAETIMELVNLTEHRKKYVKHLSGGQKQRLAIGLAMVNDPDVMFLDEPTTGLDPQARRHIWDIVLKLKELGKTTVLTTHYMEEAEKLSDRVCIVDQGKVIALDTPRELIRQLTKEREVRISFFDESMKPVLLQHIAALSDVTKHEMLGVDLRLWTTQPEETLYSLIGFTTEQGYAIDQIAILDVSLEDVFIAFTGKEWRD